MCGGAVGCNETYGKNMMSIGRGVMEGKGLAEGDGIKKMAKKTVKKAKKKGKKAAGI
jgi:hypothetical protein